MTAACSKVRNRYRPSLRPVVVGDLEWQNVFHRLPSTQDFSYVYLQGNTNVTVPTRSASHRTGTCPSLPPAVLVLKVLSSS